MKAKQLFSVLAALLLMLTMLCSPVAAEETVAAVSADLNREELLMFPGERQELKFQVLPAAADVSGITWSSDNEAVVLAADTYVTAVAAGTATVTATLPNGVSDTCKVTVIGGQALLADNTFKVPAAWTLLGGAVLEAAGGCGDSACAKIVYGGSVSQEIKNLKANTAYTLMFSVKSTADIKAEALVKGDGAELVKSEISVGKSFGVRRVTFTTPATLPAKTELVIASPTGEQDAYLVDNVLVTEKLSDADLTVELLDWEGGDGQVKPDTELVFAATVKNIGTADVTEPFKVDIAFGTEVIATVTHEGGVKAGESVTVKTEPWKAVVGDKMMSARVNPDLAVQEANHTTNNTYQTNLRVAEDRYVPAYEDVANDVAGAGMFDLTFSDDFDDLSSVDTLSSGLEGYKWYVTRQWAQADMTREDYFVKDGVFTLQHLDSRYAIGASTVDADTHTGYLYNKGYLEVKLRIPVPEDIKGANGKPAIWSLPIGKWCEIAGQNTHWVEMDWLEYYGNGRYTITLHEQEKMPDGTLNWYTSSDNSRKGLDDKEWHVMGFLWEDNSLRCYLDGKPLRDQTWSETDIPLPIHQQQSGEFRVDGVFDIFDQQDMLLYIAGGRDIPMELDYVRVWQLGGDDPNAAPEEEPEEEPAPEQTPATGVSTTAALAVAALAAVGAVAARKKNH